MEDSPLNSKGFNPFANLLGLKFTRHADGECECTLEIRRDHFNPGGVVHGGVSYSLADTTMAVALISTLEPGKTGTTIEIKMSYLAPVREGTLRAASRVIRRGKRIAFMETQVFEGERLVAAATGTFAIIDVPSVPHPAKA